MEDDFVETMNHVKIYELTEVEQSYVVYSDLSVPRQRRT
jgi:hypothetical protein